MNKALLKHLLAPGMNLMRSRNLSVKIATLSILAFIIVLGLSGYGIWIEVQTMRVARHEIQGVHWLPKITEVVHYTQRHRSLSNMEATGVPLPAGEPAQTVEQLKAAIGELDAAMKQSGSPLMADKWQGIQQNLMALMDARSKPVDALGKKQQSERVFAAHTQQVQSLRHLLLIVGEESYLLMDPQPATYFLIVALVDRYIPLMETVSQMHGEAASILGSGVVSAADERAVLGLSKQVVDQVVDMQYMFDAAQRAGQMPSAGWVTTQQLMDQYAAETVKILRADQPHVSEQDVMARGSQVLQGLMTLNQTLQQRLTERLESRLHHQYRVIAGYILVVLLDFLVLGYAVLAMHSALLGSLKKLTYNIDEMGQGRLTPPRRVDGADELAHVGAVMEDMASKLSRLVSGIRSHAVLVAMAGKELSEDTVQLAQRTEQQSQSLKEVTSRIRRIHGVVDAGVLIHESILTYSDALEVECHIWDLWCDLAKDELPLPLGGMAMRRSIPLHRAIEIENILINAVRVANANKKLLCTMLSDADLVRVKDETLEHYLNLYANNDSICMNESQHQAIDTLYKIGYDHQIYKEIIHSKDYLIPNQYAELRKQ